MHSPASARVWGTRLKLMAWVLLWTYKQDSATLLTVHYLLTLAQLTPHSLRGSQRLPPHCHG